MNMKSGSTNASLLSTMAIFTGMGISPLLKYTRRRWQRLWRTASRTTLCLTGTTSSTIKECVQLNHDKAYWLKLGNKEKEIFANLFSLEAFGQKEQLALLQNDFPDIMAVYNDFWK